MRATVSAICITLSVCTGKYSAYGFSQARRWLISALIRARFITPIPARLNVILVHAQQSTRVENNNFRKIAAVSGVILASLLYTPSAHALSRIKDIAAFEGVRENQLVGYGLVVGLKGTGDDLKKIGATKESLIGMLERLGINVRGRILDTKNVAAVLVTATLPSFARSGSTIDVTVSSLGNAKSLQGGNLAVTPLAGADGEIYAVGQGPVQVGGFTAEGSSASATRGTPTSGRIPSGGVVEREIDYELRAQSTAKLALRNPDFTTAQRISEAVNAFLGSNAAQFIDPGTVIITVPQGYRGSPVDLMSEIEALMVEPDLPARVVIDERTGVVIVGGDVRLSTVAVAQGNLTIRITELDQVSQPSPFSQTGQTAIVPRTEIAVDEGKDNKLALVKEGVRLQDLVDGLNALGVGPRDLISILQAIKAAGGLQAELQVM